MNTRIEVNLSQDRIDCITCVYQTQVRYWKEAALKNVSENDANELKVSAPPDLFLNRKPRKDAREVNIEKMFYYLKSQYFDDENQINLIKKYNSEHSLNGMLEEIKVISKHVKETENVSLKNNVLFGEWLSNARNHYKYIKNMDLPKQFDKWVHKECGMVKQTMYNYINLYKLMCIAPKLCSCRVSMTYFIKNHKTLMTYFQNEKNIPWKHRFDCKCRNCNAYFFGMGS